ncbi:MAG: ABC transporter permease [Eubacteriales bacterium]|nr:ABC transporter permease [Eubacteriales bacterium]
MSKSNNFGAGVPGLFRKLRQASTFNIFMILLGMCLIMTFAAGNKFLSVSNITSVVRQFSFYAIMSIGMVLVILTGGIDLSVGSVFAFSGVISCMAIMRWGVPVIPSVLLGILAGAVFGLLNGLCITKLQLPPFIATLGTMSIARGLSYGITGGYPIGGLPDSFKFIGLGSILDIPTPIIWMILLALLFSVFLRFTVRGRWVYAIGGNEEAARISGVKVNQTKCLVYMFSGMMAAVAGIATAARLGVGQSTAGSGYEMDAIAGVIIGGASVSGGYGNIIGPIMGAAIMGVLRNGLVLLDVSAYWQQAVIGVVIIIAVSFDKLQHDRKSASISVSK